MFYIAIPSILSLIAGLISAFAGVRFLLTAQKAKNKGIRDLGFVFLSLAGHAFSLAFISIFFLDNPLVLAWGYNVAILFIYLTLVAGVGIPVFRTYAVFRNNLNSFRLGLLLLGITIFFIQSLSMGIPEIQNNMVINWNENMWTGLVTGLISLAYSLTWTILFWKDSYVVKEGVLRLKMKILATDGILLGIAAIFSFTFLREYIFTNFAASLFIIAAIITAAIPFLPKTTPTLEGSQGE